MKYNDANIAKIKCVAILAVTSGGLDIRNPNVDPSDTEIAICGDNKHAINIGTCTANVYVTSGENCIVGNVDDINIDIPVNNIETVKNFAILIFDIF
ncbi:MAG: hypothetical protein LBC73_02155 [Oscillospiraceae bacterium]|nr:hypothetical protein [Oscillospiraceae bacterium]